MANSLVNNAYVTAFLLDRIATIVVHMQDKSVSFSRHLEKNGLI